VIDCHEGQHQGDLHPFGVVADEQQGDQDDGTELADRPGGKH
jgi:hypothetical protein